MAPESVRPPGMGGYRSHLGEFDRLVWLAVQEARRLQRPFVVDVEFLLAILHPKAGDSLAATALRDCGLSAEVLERSMGERPGDEMPSPEFLYFSPAALRLMSLAEGIAAGHGDREVGANHLLLAYLWKPEVSELRLRALGLSREEVYARLSALGVRLPQEGLPEPDPREYGELVEVSLDDLPVVRRHLGEVLPPDASFSWNCDREKGWVRLTKGLDADEYVRRALQVGGEQS